MYMYINIYNIYIYKDKFKIFFYLTQGENIVRLLKIKLVLLSSKTNLILKMISEFFS